METHSEKEETKGNDGQSEATQVFPTPVGVGKHGVTGIASASSSRVREIKDTESGKSGLKGQSQDTQDEIAHRQVEEQRPPKLSPKQRRNIASKSKSAIPNAATKPTKSSEARTRPKFNKNAPPLTDSMVLMRRVREDSKVSVNFSRRNDSNEPEQSEHRNLQGVGKKAQIHEHQSTEPIYEEQDLEVGVKQHDEESNEDPLLEGLRRENHGLEELLRGYEEVQALQEDEINDVRQQLEEESKRVQWLQKENERVQRLEKEIKRLCNVEDENVEEIKDLKLHIERVTRELNKTHCELREHQTEVRLLKREVDERKEENELLLQRAEKQKSLLDVNKILQVMPTRHLGISAVKEVINTEPIRPGQRDIEISPEIWSKLVSNVEEQDPEKLGIAGITSVSQTSGEQEDFLDRYSAFSRKIQDKRSNAAKNQQNLDAGSLWEANDESSSLAKDWKNEYEIQRLRWHTVSHEYELLKERICEAVDVGNEQLRKEKQDLQSVLDGVEASRSTYMKYSEHWEREYRSSEERSNQRFDEYEAAIDKLNKEMVDIKCEYYDKLASRSPNGFDDTILEQRISDLKRELARKTEIVNEQNAKAEYERTGSLKQYLDFCRAAFHSSPDSSEASSTSQKFWWESDEENSHRIAALEELREEQRQRRVAERIYEERVERECKFRMGIYYPRDKARYKELMKMSTGERWGIS